MTAQDPIGDYAAWTALDSSLKVVYSIPLFHEIDFVVNEGYRRIPHGGLEVGGLLFGRKQSNSVQIEAFRPIECEHSTGPSFVLSARDVEGLEVQLRTAAQDPELQDLIPVGWFISHSRSDLVLTEREAALFDQLFPHPNEVTVLVKPIKFQPTRFAFLVRDAHGNVKRDGTQQAIILPLAGRTSRASVADPAPSLSAPAYHAEEPVTVAQPVDEPAPEPLVIAPHEPATAPNPPAKEVPDVPLEDVPAVGKPASAQALEEAKVEEEPLQANVPVPPPPPLPVAESAAPARPSAALPHTFLTTSATPPRSNVRIAEGRNRGVSVLVSVAILLVAVAAGFAIGYVAYSRLSFSAISLTVEDHPPVLFVSWPADDSRDADSASIRIDDGPPRPLTLQEKAGGQAQITLNGDSVKVEIVTHSWFHDSRGIVRYVRPSGVPLSAAPEPGGSTIP
jgi:hypothetical protein